MTQDQSNFPASASERQRSEAILTALAQANQQLFRPGELDEQLPKVLVVLGETIMADRVNLYENVIDPTEKLIAHQRAAWSALADGDSAAQKQRHAFEYTHLGDANVTRLEGGLPVYGRAADFPAKIQAYLTAQAIQTLAVVPIFSEGKWWGLLSFEDHNQDRIWSAAEIDALKNVAATLGAAVENDQRYSAEKSARQRAELLHHVAGIISASLDREDVLQRTLDQLSLVLSFDSAAIFLFPQNQQPEKMIVSGHADPALIISIASKSIAETPVVQQMLNDHRPILSNDVRQLAGWVWMEGAEHVRSFMAAPLLIQGQMMGVLMVDSQQPDFYNQSDLQIVSGLAQTAAIAIQNADLHSESQQQAKELQVLHQVALAAATAVTVDELLTLTTDVITQTVYPNHFGFLLKGKGDDYLMPHFAFHPNPAQKPVPAPLLGSLVGRAVRTGEPTIVADVTQDPDYLEIRPTIRSEIAVPVRISDEIVGVINVESNHFNAFNQNDLRFLTTLSQLVASFIERAQLYQTVQEQADSLADDVKKQTVELQQEKDRLQTILDSAGEGIIITDLHGIVQYANPALSRLTGFQESEILGRKSNLWRSHKTPKETYQDMWGTILSGNNWHGELVNQTKQGMYYDANLTIAPIFDEQRQMLGFVGIQSDISRLKNMERLKSRFITDVSHELRTPVTNLKLYTDLLMRTPADKHGRYFDVLQVQVIRLEQIIEDILTLSRLEGTRINLELTLVDLNLLANQTQKMLQSTANSTGLTLKFTPYPAVEPICGEPALLRQLITNLTKNAINYTPAGEIEIATLARPNSGYVELVIRDTGVGIDPEERPYIFDRFFRGKFASHSNISGSGLGLTIVREIVEMLGGQIEIESEPEVGTKVSVLLKTAAESRVCQ